MANHFASIGFSVAGPGEMDALLARLETDSEVFASPVGGRYLRYETPEGCELWALHAPDGQLVGCNPHYAGSSRVRMTVEELQATGPTPLDGHLVGRLSDDQLGVPLVLDVPDYRLVASRLEPGRELTVQVAAFPHELDVFNTREEHAASAMGQLSADGALIPSGTFTPDGAAIDPPQPFAIIAGPILSVMHLANSVTGERFYVLQVGTLGGTVDVVASEAELETDPLVGGVAAGSFYLTGRVIEGLSDEPGDTASDDVDQDVLAIVSAFRGQFDSLARSPQLQAAIRERHKPSRWRYVLEVV